MATSTPAIEPGHGDVVDRVMWALDDEPGKDYSPSEIARVKGVRATTEQAQYALAELVRIGFATTTDRGAWSRYQSIRNLSTEQKVRLSERARR